VLASGLVAAKLALDFGHEHKCDPFVVEVALAWPEVPEFVAISACRTQSELLPGLARLL